MRRLFWWMRSMFCGHQWRSRGTTVCEVRLTQRHPVHDKYTLDIKECTKCGWIWRQRI